MTYPAHYAKGSDVRIASTPRDAVRLEFAGFKLVSVDEDADYRDLQAQAKELGIAANQSAAALTEQINAALEGNADDTSDDDAELDSHEGDQSVDTVGTVTDTSDPTDFDARF